MRVLLSLPAAYVNELYCSCVCSYAPQSKDAVLALAKHVVLKAPDRAEHRAIAADAAVQLTQMLPAQDQYAFVVFAACLSRSAKVSNTIDLSKLVEKTTDCGNAC